MVQHSSTVVCTAKLPHYILIEPRDQYHNLCSFLPGKADTHNYSISIKEVCIFILNLTLILLLYVINFIFISYPYSDIGS